MKKAASIYDETPVYAIFKSLTTPSLRPTTLRCVLSIFFNFFFRQYYAAWLPGRVPVSKVDHPLDLKIPFIPAWVTIYLDFIAYWIRMLSFLLRVYGRRAYDTVREFIASIDKLYAFAAEAYQKNFSTTDRPFYIARPRFFVIHLLDPHLMCIPSLHVMVVIWTYTRFAAILRSLNETEQCAARLAEMKQGAQAITQAILFVKQHSVNCVAAAMYAMTRFDPNLFPPEEAEAFTARLFGDPPPPPDATAPVPSTHPAAAPRTQLPAADAAEIRAHILSLYRLFLDEGKNARDWTEPLMRFLREMPRLR